MQNTTTILQGITERWVLVSEQGLFKCQFSVGTWWYFWVSTKPEAILSPCYELRAMLSLSCTKIWGGNVNYTGTAAPGAAFKPGILFLTFSLNVTSLVCYFIYFSKWQKCKSQWFFNIFQLPLNIASNKSQLNWLGWGGDGKNPGWKDEGI